MSEEGSVEASPSESDDDEDDVEYFYYEVPDDDVDDVDPHSSDDDDMWRGSTVQPYDLPPLYEDELIMSDSDEDMAPRFYCF